MIGSLRGRLLQKSPPMLVVDVQGVGYEVEAPLSTFYQLPETGQEIHLYTHLTVRDDAHLLFAFASERERQLFRALIKVNGVGPKSALSILSGLSVDELMQAVALQETALLTRVPGVGKKTAERLMLELKDKFAIDGVTAMRHHKSASGDVLNALLALGYNEREALAAVKQLPADVVVAEGIRQALKSLSKA